MRTTATVSLVIVALFGVVGCDTDLTRPLENANPLGMATEDTGQEYEIEATDDRKWAGVYFNQQQRITIVVGRTVRWTSHSHLSHSVLPAGHEEFEGAELRPNASGLSMFEHTFNNRGTFDFYCGEHEGMRGTVVVLSQYGQ